MNAAAKPRKRSPIDVFQYLDYRVFLADFYRAKKRSGFSYRAFSRAAGLGAPNYLKLVMDGDRNAAIDHAIALANCVWKHHQKMQVPLVSLSESVRMAAQVPAGTVVMMDAADATSSGASGDSNAILTELMRQNYRGQVLAPIFDPPTVRKAFESGVGAEIDVAVGGAFDSGRFTPLPIRGKVRLLSDGKFRSESFGWHWDSGPTAVIQSNNYTLVIGTRPVSLFDRSWFYSCGQDPKRFDLVIVKSPHCEQHMFSQWCAKQINVDAPGSTSANVRSLGHKKCARPIFPLDDDVMFSAHADVFDRSR
jgi:microcystin degradation protein MlrC